MTIDEITGSAGRFFSKRFITVDQAREIFEHLDPRHAQKALRIVERIRGAKHAVKRLGELSLIALAKCREQSRSPEARRRRHENETHRGIAWETTKGLDAWRDLCSALESQAATC